MNDAMATRVKLARQKRGYKSARAAAAAMGLIYSTYSGHERYGKIPRDDLVRYARFFGVSVDWLLYGKGGSAPVRTTAITQLTVPFKQIPLYKLAELTVFKEIRDNATSSTSCEYIAVPDDTPHTAFAVTITDKSMMQSTVPSLEPGNIVVIDPASEGQPGELVFAVVGGFREGIVRRLGRIIKEGITYIVLTPLNQSFETVTFVPDDENYILGRVRTAVINF